MAEYREPSVFWALVKVLLIIALALYVVWGIGWYLVTPAGLREMPIWLVWAVCMGILYLITWPIEAITGLSVSEPVMINFTLLLDKIGLWKIIDNFGSF